MNLTTSGLHGKIVRTDFPRQFYHNLREKCLKFASGTEDFLGTFPAKRGKTVAGNLSGLFWRETKSL